MICVKSHQNETQKNEKFNEEIIKKKERKKNEVYKVLAAATSCVDNLGCRTASCTSQTPPTQLPCCPGDDDDDDVEEKAGEDYDDTDDEVDDEDGEDGSTGDDGGGDGGGGGM